MVVDPDEPEGKPASSEALKKQLQKFLSFYGDALKGDQQGHGMVNLSMHCMYTLSYSIHVVQTYNLYLFCRFCLC